jgi:hypothetical protein
MHAVMVVLVLLLLLALCVPARQTEVLVVVSPGQLTGHIHH